MSNQDAEMLKLNTATSDVNATSSDMNATSSDMNTTAADMNTVTSDMNSASSNMNAATGDDARTTTGRKYHCRKLGFDDLERVMHWRMSQHVTKYMNTDPVLTIEAQKKWFQELTDTEANYYWVIEVDDTPCGVINLEGIDVKNKRCTWGYYVAEKSLRSFRLSMCLEMSLYDYVFDIVGMNKISGESFCENAAAIKMHEMCGCETEGVLKMHIFKNGQFYDVCVQSMYAQLWRKIRSGFQYQKIKFEDT